MNISVRHLLFLLVVSGLLLITVGCSQKDDVVQPNTMATITLAPSQLPTLDTLYAYELWMVKIDGGDSTFRSLGKFLWNNYWNRFYNLNGEIISGTYEVPDPWYGYDKIMVTVENRVDPDPLTPSGTILAIDDVIDPTTRPIKMQFPGYVFEALGYYFVGTPTNDTSVADALDNVDDARGLWLCSRALTQRQMQDTLGIDTFTVRQTEQDTNNKYAPDTIGVAGWVLQDSVMVIIGYDTIRDHRRIEISYIDTVDTNHGYVLSIEPDTTPTVIHEYYAYSSPMENLPDIRPYGWRYNAWVLMDQSGGYDLGLERMVPFGFDGQWRWTGDTIWGVLPLGAFSRPDSADLANPYISNREVPNFPGEDFVVDAGAYGAVNLRRPFDGFWGSIVVGMEPDPDHVTIDPNRNFPLLFMADSLRSGLNSAAVYRAPHPLHNWSQTMPTIRVTVVFHQ
jgi:hypothetical protein